jgi:hypothetical protein
MSNASSALMSLRQSKCISRTELALYLVQTTDDETKWSPEMLRNLEDGRLPLRLHPHIDELKAVKQQDTPVFTPEEIDLIVQAIKMDVVNVA